MISLTSVSIANFLIQQVKVGAGVDLGIHMLGTLQHCTRGDCADRELDSRKKSARIISTGCSSKASGIINMSCYSDCQKKCQISKRPMLRATICLRAFGDMSSYGSSL